jgi:hypothetical protein
MVSPPSRSWAEVRADLDRVRERRLRRGWRGPCEAGVGVNPEFGQPLIQKCHEPGQLFEGGLFGMVLCPEHEGLKELWKQQEMTVQRDKLAKAKIDKGRSSQ